MAKKVIVIGSGFSGLSGACLLAKHGYEVTVLEKNATPGGRARQFSAEGFTWDMGPSWYWMPDVFESFFNLFGKSASDYYRLHRLDPSYRIYFGKNDIINLPASTEGMEQLFESYEKGAGLKLRRFLKEAEYKYQVGMSEFVHKPSLSFLEYASPKFLGSVFKLHMLQSFESYTKKYFKHPRLLQMLEFPVLFLGGTGKSIPALYSLMNYGDIKLGTWYPEGGMYSVVKAFVELAESLGVKFRYNAPVDKILVNAGRATGVMANHEFHMADYILGSGDYHHIEQQLLPAEYRKYTPEYWENRMMSPSALIYFLGFKKKLTGFEHHTLFFDTDFGRHSADIYESPRWPVNPAVYFSVTSLTDNTAAPQGMENMYVLIPIAAGLDGDDFEVREKYLDLVLKRIEYNTGISAAGDLVYSRPYSLKEFNEDYHAFKGNAYGLANTLMQTAFLKPSMNNRKVSNLFYAGQLTVPGPGVPPAIISGQVAAKLIINRGNS